jgi:hypothetical protein
MIKLKITKFKIRKNIFFEKYIQKYKNTTRRKTKSQ